MGKSCGKETKKNVPIKMFVNGRRRFISQADIFLALALALQAFVCTSESNKCFLIYSGSQKACIWRLDYENGGGDRIFPKLTAVDLGSGFLSV